MKFILNSDREHIKGATIEEHWYTHIRTCKSFKEFDERFAHNEGTWTSQGKNHRLVPAEWYNGRSNVKYVAREEPRTVRVLNIETLDELAALADYYGDVTVKKSEYIDVPLELRIEQ